MKYTALHTVAAVTFTHGTDSQAAGVRCSCGTETTVALFQRHRVEHGESPKTVAGSRALADGKAGSFGHSRKR